MDTAPKASGCILGGNRKDLQGGTGKAEDAKLPGAGIIPKLCPRKGAAEMGSKHCVHSNDESLGPKGTKDWKFGGTVGIGLKAVLKQLKLLILRSGTMVEPYEFA